MTSPLAPWPGTWGNGVRCSSAPFALFLIDIAAGVVLAAAVIALASAGGAQLFAANDDDHGGRGGGRGARIVAGMAAGVTHTIAGEGDGGLELVLLRAEKLKGWDANSVDDDVDDLNDNGCVNDDGGDGSGLMIHDDDDTQWTSEYHEGSIL